MISRPWPRAALVRWSCLLLALWAMAGLSAADIALSVDQPLPVVGSTVTVTVTLNSAPAFDTWGLQVDFNSSYLQLVSQSAGSFSTFVPDARSLAMINAASEIHLGGYGSGTTDNAGGTGTLAVLQFVVLAAGSPTISTVPRDSGHPFGDTLFTSIVGPVSAFTSVVPTSDAALTISARNLDTVTLASAVNAYASGAPDGSFTITRSGSIGSITVPLQVSGTANPGIDYATLPSSVTFGPGVTSIPIDIHGLHNTAIDGTQTIALDLLPGTTYTLASARSAQALLLDDLGPTTSITVSATSVSVDQTLTVTVSVANAPTFLEWGELLRWSPNMLKLISQTPGDFSTFVPDARPLSAIDAANEVHAGGYGSVSGSGRLAVFTFQVIASGSILLTAPAQGGGEPFGLKLWDAGNHPLVPLAAPAVTVTAVPADVITISSSQPIASEVGPTPAYVTVSRDRTLDAQTVSLLASGTTSPSLWVAVPSSVSFAIGQSSVTFPLLPIDDHIVEGTLNLVMTVGPGALYTVGNPSSVTITRLDADGSDLSLTSNTARPALNGTVQVMLQLTDGPAFSQFGGIVRFPTANLALVSQAAGSASFGTFVPDARSLAQINASGEVHVGTYTTADQAGGSGNLVVLTFNVIGSGTAVVTSAPQSNGVPFGDALLTQAGLTTLPTVANVLTLQISADHAPTAIALSNTHVRQGLPVGTLVGQLTDTDPDVGDYATYALVSGSGSTDNAKFTISGSELLTDYVFTYSVQQTASVLIQATDSGGLTFQQAFTISIDPGGGILYVRPGATGSGNGSSWANAFTDLAPALLVANSGTQVWVAGGTYRPTSGTDTTQSLSIPAGVAVYGGFVGTESTLSRSWPANLTTLTGVISGGASRHVVALAAGATLDGVVVSGGFASNTLADQNGAGVLVGAGATTALVSHCIITGNHAATTGGAVYSQGAPTVIENCVLDSNLADGGAAGFAAASGAHSLICDTLTNGIGQSCGGAAVSGSATLSVVDTVFDANTVPVLLDTSSASLTYTSCCLPDGTVTNGYSLGGSLNVDPLLVNVGQPAGADGIWFTPDDGIQLTAVSPCRLAGAQAGLPDDLYGDPRPASGGIDMGATEFETTGGTAPTITSPMTANGTVGAAFSFALAASGTMPISFLASPLPDGLTLEGGVITGTPQSAGTTLVTVQAANSVGFAAQPQSLSIIIASAGTAVAPVLTCPATATAYVGIPFSFPITTTGTQPVSVAAAPLPAGLSLFGSDIQGTPTTVGSTYITLGASNSAGIAAPASVLVTVVQPVAPSFIGPTSLVAVVNQPFTYTIGANGTLPITFTASPLPPGLTYSNGAISGTPTVVGATMVGLTATNVVGSATPETLTINVDTPATITSALSVSGTVGTAFLYTPTATGTGPITFTATPLPAGLSFDGTSISGTPTATGTTMVALTATNPTGPTSATLQIQISTLTAPVFTSPAVAFGTVGSLFTLPLTATGSAPITFAVTTGTLGDGLSLASGVISGTPATAAAQSVTITATGPGGQATQNLTLTMEVPAVITSGTSASGFVGSAFSYPIGATGSNLVYAATPLPPGLSLVGAAITGTPTTVGDTTVNLVVSNDISSDAISLDISIAAAVKPVFTSSAVAAGALGAPFSFTLTADGTQPITYAVTTGTLPDGLSLANGVISGTPTTVEASPVTITASNAFGTAQQNLTITIQIPPTTITSPSSDSARVGDPYSYTITSDGTAPLSDTATPLPPGLGLSGGVISGVPTTAGSTTIALGAANLVGTATGSLTLVVQPAIPPSITSAAAAVGSVGQSFQFTIVASGDPVPVISALDLPPGLTLSGGVISGTPTTAGVTDVAVTASNAGGTVNQTLQLTLQVPAMVSSPLTASGTVGTPFSYTLTATGTAPVTLDAINLPAGLTYSAGMITGTPTTAASSSITLSASNLAHTDIETLALTVAAATQPTFTSPTSLVAAVGATVDFPLSATGSVPITYTSTTLPDGLAISGAAITGVPTTAGITAVTLTATNAGGSVTQPLTVTVQVAPTITNSGSADGTVGAPFSYQITGAGTAVTYSTTTLPDGLMLIGDTISGAPTTAGTTSVTLMASNLVGNAMVPISIVIAPAVAPQFGASTVNLALEVGQPITPYTVSATGSATITYGASGLPSALSLSNGVISGTVDSAGVTSVTLTATNAGGSASQTLVITAQLPPAITNLPLPLTAGGTVGVPFSYTVTASGTAPVTIGASPLPAGLSIANGVISGTPTASGTTAVTLSAGNLVFTDTQVLTITIAPATAPTTITPVAQALTLGQAASIALTSDGTMPITWTAAPLPAGLSLVGATITGTPTSAGITTVLLTASNAGGSASQDLVLTVQAPAMILDAGSASGQVGTPFTFTITTSGTGPITYTASPLPAGLSVSGAVISGTPTAAGPVAVTLTASNLVHTDTETLELTIAPASAPQITSADAVTAAVGAPFTYDLVVTGSPTPVVTSAALPAGLSLSGDQISGTPTTAGVFPVLVTATNAGGQGTQTLTITLEVTPGLGALAPVQGAVAEPFTYTIPATGSTLSYAASPLPAGLSLSGNVISGLPTALGTTAVTITASNDVGSATQILQLSIIPGPPPSFTSAATATATVGQPFSYLISATAADAISYGTGVLPTGLSLAGALISGTPISAGVVPIALSATDLNGTATQVLTLTILQAPVVVSAPTASGTVGVPFSTTIVAAGSLPQTFTATPLPAGLTLSGAVISGTPTAQGTTDVGVSVSNAGGTGTATLVITIGPSTRPVITSNLALAGTVGAKLDYTITASGTAPIAFSASPLPPGMTLAGAALGGVPSAAGTYDVVLGASNGGGTAIPRTLVVTVDAATPPVITSVLAASGTVGAPFAYSIAASGSQPITMGASPLPPGLTFTGATISGTPTTAGTTQVTLSASNAGGTAPPQVLVLTITPGVAPALTSPLTADGTVGVPFSYLLTASGVAPLSFACSSLPAGLALSGATISGTPTSAGTLPVGVTISEATGQSTLITLSLVIAPAVTPVITSPLTATATIGTPFSYVLTASGSAPITYSASPLPSWLTLSGGVLAGTPTDALGSPFAITLGATNSGGAASPAVLMVSVAPAVAPIITSSASAVLTVGAPVALALTASGSQPITFTSSALPAGLALVGSTIVGTPTMATTGTSVTITATNAAGPATQSLQLVILPSTAPTITMATSLSGTVGSPFAAIISLQGSSPFTYQTTALPGGLSLSGNLISGTPLIAGQTLVGVTVMNAGGTAQANVLITILPAIAPLITSPATASATVGVACSIPLTASGTAPVAFQASGLPPGLSLAGAAISGTPSVAGTTQAVITASNGGGSTTQDLVITVQAAVAPVFTSPATASGIVGAPFALSLTASGTGPVTITATQLPAGFSLGGAVAVGAQTEAELVGVLPGSPQALTIALSAQNAAGAASQQLVITVTPPAPTITQLTPPGGPDGGGTAVTLSGTALDQVSAVTFGGVAGTIVAQSATTLVVRSPAHADGLAVIAFQSPAGAGQAPTSYAFVPPAAVVSLTPTVSPTAGGSTISLNGTNLTGLAGIPDQLAVTFDGIPATITLASATSVVVQAPPHAAGTVDVVYSALGGTFTVTSAFTYSDTTLTGTATFGVTGAQTTAGTAGGAGAGGSGPTASSSRCGLGGGMSLVVMGAAWFLRRRSRRG